MKYRLFGILLVGTILISSLGLAGCGSKSEDTCAKEDALGCVAGPGSPVGHPGGAQQVWMPSASESGRGVMFSRWPGGQLCRAGAGIQVQVPWDIVVREGRSAAAGRQQQMGIY